MTFAKIGKQLIALFLCMAIALGPSISAANAEEQSELSAAGKSTEVLALRQENEKHFSMGNGTYQAITYGHPVHELDSDGNWQDIDFSLTLSGTRGNRKYTNESATASFPEQYTANQPILTLGEKDRTIAMALLAAEKDGASNRAAVTAEVTNPQNSFRTLEEAKNANFASTVLYKDVLPGVDLEYIVDPGTVKENIIVEEKASSYRYTFTLNMTGLYPTLLKDGSIIVRDQETDAKKYEIPAPFMYDALGNMSEDVTYTLLGTNDTYTLTVTANADWINAKGRNFPVTIDPTYVETTPFDTDEFDDVGYDCMEDTYIDSDDPNVAHGFKSLLWVRSNRITYIKVPTPQLPQDAIVDWAELSAYYYYYSYVTGGMVRVSAHNVIGSWSEDDLTWNSIANVPNHGLGATVLDSVIATAGSQGEIVVNNPREACFTITDTFKQWISGELPNYGIGLKYVADSVNLSVLFKSSESGYTHCPRITYQYAIRKFWLKNYRDSSLSDTDINNITAAISFADSAFHNQFGIRIYNDGTPHINDVFTDVCEHGNDQQCTTETCTDHYTDVIYISEQLYNLWATDWDHSKRIVYWTDRSPSAYCTHENGYCAPFNFSGNGVVIAHVYDHQPAIHFLNIIPDNGTNEQRLACMGLTLVHELAHTFGMDDVYNEAENEDEDKEPEIHHEDGFQCVMEKFGENDAADALTFYNAIQNKTQAAFCDECAALLTDAILP